MEDAANTLGARLAHCAGYDVRASTEFWMRFHRQDWLRWFRDPTHRSAKSRAKRLGEQAEALTCPVTLTGSVDD